MSIELVERATALTSGDGLAPDAELEELFTPDVVLDLSARVFNPKVYEGYEGLREFHADSREVWEHVELTIDEVIDEGDRYVVLGEGRSRGRASGMEIAAGFTGIWTMEGGRLKSYRLLSPNEADRDLGLAALREPAR
jgi:ketosteroid isomerase-like protein